MPKFTGREVKDDRLCVSCGKMPVSFVGSRCFGCRHAYGVPCELKYGVGFWVVMLVIASLLVMAFFWAFQTWLEINAWR